MEFSDWLRKELEGRGWTQGELARRAGVSTGTLSMAINYQRGVGPEFCKAIAKAFGLPPEVVFRKAGLLPSIEELDDKSLSELISIFNNLDWERRTMLLKIARDFYLPPTAKE